jgi:hypothetical protein
MHYGSLGLRRYQLTKIIARSIVVMQGDSADSG